MKKIIYPTLLGTTAMTAFSYIISKKKHRNFLEPNVLAQLIYRLHNGGDKKESELAGLSGHYITGLLFVLIYIYLWEHANVKPTLSNGIGLGAAAGICGIAAWELMLKLHPDPPAKNKKRYFGHLFLAHLVFGVFSTIGYQLACESKNWEPI